MVNEIINEDESRTSNSNRCYINMKMLPAKLSFLFLQASMGSIAPFLSLFIVSLGLTPAHAGMIASISSIFSFLSGVIWGRLSDYTGRRKLIFIVLCLGTILSIFPMPWIGNAIAKMDTKKTCLNSSFTSSFTGNQTNCVISHRLLNASTLVYTFITLSSISKLFYLGLISFIEGIVMNVVSNNELRTGFGPQKMFAPLGFALGSYISGVAVDHYTIKGISEYAAIFYVFLPCVVLVIPVGYILVGQAKFEGEKENRNRTVNARSQLKLIFKSFNNLLVLLSVFISGMLLHVFMGFGFLLMNDELHFTKTMMSYVVIISMISELFVFILSTKLIKLLGGNIPCIILGMLSYFFRFIAMSYARNAYVILLVQVLQGIGVSLTWTCFVQHANEVFPKEIVMTAIMIMTTFHLVLSATVANMVSGIIYHRFGGRILFRGASILAGIWSAILILHFGLRFKIRRSKRYSLRVQPESFNMDTV